MRVTVFDYGAGNLHSLAKALAAPGSEVRLEEDPARAVETDVLVLPGVGAFAAAAERLAPGRSAMREAIAGGLRCVGICLGMQLLFATSDEGGGDGLGVIPGRVERVRSRRIPHIGWNTIEPARPLSPLLGQSPLDAVYYAHSFVCRPESPEAVVAWTTHEGDRFPAIVRSGAALGVQFHPEKSSRDGVAFLRTAIAGVDA